jgi:hypothetical protein
MLGLEAIHGHLLPFYALVHPAVGSNAGSIVENLVRFGWLVVALAILGAALAALNRIVLSLATLDASPKLARRHLAAIVLFAAAFPAAVAMIRGGPEILAHPYSRHAYEYISDIGTGGSIRGLFHDYEKVHPYLSMHSKVHPPGPIAILWLMSYVVGRTEIALSIATILFGALSVVPMYYWAVDALGPRRGLIATLLYVTVPTIVLFTATSADIAFMPFTVTTLFLFWRSIHAPHRSAAVPAATGDSTPRTSSGIHPETVIARSGVCDEAISSTARGALASSTLYALAAGIVFGLLGLISYSLLSVGAFFALVGLWRLANTRYRWAVVRTAVVMTVAALGVHYLVNVWSGYSSIDVFQLSKHQFDTDQANLNALDPRVSSIWWKLLNPLSWFLFLGVPISVLFLGCFADAQLRRNPFVWIVGLSLIAFDILYLARGEGERSAMYIVPFIVLAAAWRLDGIVAAAGNWRPLTATLAFLGLQTIAIECVLYTYW